MVPCSSTALSSNTQTQDNKKSEATKLNEPEDNANDQAPKSLKCNDCGKYFSSVEFAQLHAAKSGHQDFCESENVAGADLTPEQKSQRLAELRAKLAEKRKQEAELREKEAHQAELLRRKGGQMAAEARRAVAERDMKKAAEDLRRGREEDRQIRARIRAEIEAERKLWHQQQNIKAMGEMGFEKVEPIKLESQAASMVRIQVKLPDGSQLRETFKPEEKLACLLDKISNKYQITPQSTLTVPFPHKLFNLTADHDQSFMELGLCPSASLIFQP